MKGFTLIETLIATSLFVVIGYALYLGYSGVSEAIIRNESRLDATALLESEMEKVRNLKFEDIGIFGGYPAGKLPAEKTASSTNGVYSIKTTVRNIDNPFDGTLGGSPNDTAPADYKMVEMEISCVVCVYNFTPFSLTTFSSPKALEGTSRNGALFINVFDASGQPVAGVNVKVANNSLNPTILVNDTTNNNGVLQLVDIPTSTSAYEITVSKTGYSSEKTYSLGGAGNPNPVKPHATVAEQTVTSASFSIDKTGSFNFMTADALCRSVSDVDFSIYGVKLIGTNPNVLKYSVSAVTDGSGAKTFNNLEWDTYNLNNLDSAYETIGIVSSSSVVVNPNTNNSLKWVMQPLNPRTLLVDVRDQNNQPVPGASVRLATTSYDRVSITGRYPFSQTDWSGGAFSSQSGQVETEGVAGRIFLKQVAGVYPTSTEWLISNTFDLGASNVNFYAIEWQPISQPPQAGDNSLRFQIATNNDNSTWNFVGPDNAENSFYSSSSEPINAAHNGNRYLRYKVFLKTSNQNFTPSLEEIKFIFNSSCVPGGQTFFDGLSSGTYSLTVQKAGHQNFVNNSLLIPGNWQRYSVQFSPL